MKIGQDVIVTGHDQFKGRTGKVVSTRFDGRITVLIGDQRLWFYRHELTCRWHETEIVNG